jgi:hypothetical protein
VLLVLGLETVDGRKGSDARTGSRTPDWTA